jgi:hypothetical protein
MIPLEKIPRSGQLIIAIHFRDYGDYYANETRQTLLKLPGRREIKSIDVELYPLDYWLKRTIITEEENKKNEKLEKNKKWNRTRATGGLYKIGFVNMTPEKFKKLYNLLENKIKKTYWEEIELLIANSVEGI